MSEPAAEQPVDTAPDDSGGDTQPDVPGIPFEALLLVEGVETSDDRFIEPNATTWREPPLPLMAQLKSEHGGFADTAAEIAGRIDTITREPLGTWDGSNAGGTGFEIIARGIIDAAGTIGLETARFIAGQFLRGVSADMAMNAADIEITDVDEDGYPIGERLIVTDAELGMATITPFAAFAECQIRLLEDVEPADDPLAMPEMPEVGDRIPILADGNAKALADLGVNVKRQSFTYTMTEGCLPCEQRGTIVAAGGPLAPPAEWFTDPGLDGPTPPTVTPDGRVFGHIAPFDVCHTGFPGMCKTAPRNADYSYFETGAIVTDDGQTIPVGQLTLEGGHADLALGWRAAMAHYDDTNSAVADVRVGEDAHGVWFAGALRPGVTDEEIRVFLASPLSGDWRPIGGDLKLLAACSVNVQGFPIRRAHVASGHTTALVASTGLQPTAPEVTSPAPGTVAAALPPDVVEELTVMARENKAERALRTIDRLLA